MTNFSLNQSFPTKKGQQQKTLSTFYLLHKKQTHNRGGQHNWNKFPPLNPCFLSSAQHLPQVLSPFIYIYIYIYIYISHWREFLSPLKVAKPAACTSLYGCLSKFSSRSKWHLLTFGGGHECVRWEPSYYFMGQLKS